MLRPVASPLCNGSLRVPVGGPQRGSEGVVGAACLPCHSIHSVQGVVGLLLAQMERWRVEEVAPHALYSAAACGHVDVTQKLLAAGIR